MESLPVIRSSANQPCFKNNIAVLFFLVLIAISETFPREALSSEQQQLFILHSYSQEYPWTKFQHEGFIDSYYSDKTQHSLISTEYLDTKRKNYTSEYADKFATYLRDKYAGYKPDLIYVTDDHATVFAMEKLVKIFPTSAIIFSGVNNYNILNKLDTKRFTGVFEKKEISPNLELLGLIDNSIRRIIVIGDNSSTYQAIEVEIKEQLKNHPDIDASYIATKQIEELISTLRSHNERYVFLTTIGEMTDPSGHPLTLNETISRISNAGDYVILSMEDAYLLDGVLGGYVTSGRQQGRMAARLAAKYQQGMAIDQIPVILESPNEYIFDYRELAKNKLELPDAILRSAKIIHIPLSFYERNRTFILGGIAGLTILLVSSMATSLVLIARKNKQIRMTSQKIAQQSATLRRVKDTLTTAQKIAHLGNWEWNLSTGEINWSDETYQILGEQPCHIKASYENLISYIAEEERDNIKSALEESIRSNKPYELEHWIVRRDGSRRYIQQIGDIHNDSTDQSRVLIGTLLDVTSIKEHELLELERLETIERYQDALLEWSRVDYKNIDQAFERATEISASTLHVSRVSIWLYSEDYKTIKCQDLFTLDEGHSKDLEIHLKNFPRYFKALKSGKMIAAVKPRQDERPRELTETYLIPNNIYSMLDTPILYAGEVIGVVCHEHTGSTREWTLQEQEFASAIASTVSLSLEIQKRREMEKKLEHQAYHDALTNLPNRSLFLDRLDQAIKMATRTNSMVAVLFLDLDNFKEINDSLGHAAGDQVLTNIASRLRDNLRDVDTIARLGGDEFTLIMSSFRDTQNIHDIALKLFNILKGSIFIDEHEIYVTSSIGISIYPNDGETPETLLRNADAAMYKAKEKGTNSFEFYTHDMTERAFERVLMETNLRRALQNQEFVIFYQPQFDARTRKLIGMEALIRWRHPELGMISPAKFIPVAEDTGLIVQLDRWVMQTATKQFAEWVKAGLKPGRLALNIATKQFEQVDLIDMLKTTLYKSNCKPEWLSFEVTESQIMKNPEKAISILREIHTLGIEIAVDDFGTGYSSLTYLKRLPVDKLKIDQAFINDVPYDDEDVAIVRAIIALSNSLNLSVIAEGVENQEQVNFLLKEGCPLIQGFFYAAPMPSHEMEHLLNVRT